MAGYLTHILTLIRNVLSNLATMVIAGKVQSYQLGGATMLSMTKRVGLVVALVGLAVGTAQRAEADLALTFDETTGSSGSNSNQSVGWQFDVLSSLNVTGLAWYDEGQDGLALAHTVGIWDPSGNLPHFGRDPRGDLGPARRNFPGASDHSDHTGSRHRLHHWW